MEIPEYIQNIIYTTPPINEKKLRTLLNLYRKKRDSKIKEQIINSYLKVVVRIAKKFYKRYPELEISDLIEEGIIGLLKAINRYNPTYKSSFLNYAKYWIKQSIQLYINERPFTAVQLPRSSLQHFKKWIEVWQKIFKQTGEQPSLSEMAKRLKISYYKAKQIYERLKLLSTTQSLATPVGEDITIEDRIEDKSESLEDILALISARETLEEVFKKVLTDKEVTIIKQRYQQWGKGRFKKRLSYRTIAKMLHLSHEYVRRKEKEILKKLAEYVKNKFY